jgi:flagellar biogenesis protein FliO
MMLMLLTASISTEAATPENAVDFTWLFVNILPRLGIARGNHRGRYFKVHGRYQLEPRKSLYVVEVGGRYLVIGSADHGINLITELSPEEAMGDRGKKAQ